MLYVTYCLVICIVIVWIYFKKFRQKSVERVPPELSGKLPFIGHALRLSGDAKQGALNVQSISKECLQKGGITTMYFGWHLTYVVANPEECFKISNLCLEKAKFYDIAKPLLGNGLNIANVPKWKRNRKMLNMAFNKQTLNSFMAIFNKQSRKLVHSLAENVDKGYFCHNVPIQRINLDSICLTSYGFNLEKYESFYEDFTNSLNEILDLFYDRFTNIWLHNNYIYNMTSMKKRQDRIIENIERFTNTILADKRKALKNENKTQTQNIREQETFQPFMDIMLRSAMETDCFNDKDILYETHNLVIGGFDTSTVLLTFILTILGSNLDIQDKIYNELLQIFGDTDRDVNEEDLNKLIYLEAVIKETLRLYPVAAVTARQIDKDVYLKNYTLKAGSSCLLLYWGLHKHHVWGEDRELFRPERWLEDTLPNVHNAFAAFSLGRRNCIGKTYAMMSIKTNLVHLIRSYNIYSDISKMVLKVDVLLRPHSGHEIKIVKR